MKAVEAPHITNLVDLPCGRDVLHLAESGLLSLIAPPVSSNSRRAKSFAMAFPVMKSLDESEKPLVVVVDDSESIRNSTQRLIRSFGFRTEAFASASDFLHSPVIGDCHCLILDVRMPRIDGLELQQQLASTHPTIPIVFFTAHGNDEEQLKAINAGAVAFLRKPVSPQILLNAINDAVRNN